MRPCSTALLALVLLFAPACTDPTLEPTAKIGLSPALCADVICPVPSSSCCPLAGDLVVTDDLIITTSMVRHFPRTHSTPASMATPDSRRDSTGSQFIVGISTARITYPLFIEYPGNGSIIRITRWALRLFTASGFGTLTGQLYKRNSVTGIETPVGPTKQLTNIAVGATALSALGLAIDSQPADHDQFYVAFTGGGFAGDIAYHLEYDLTDP